MKTILIRACGLFVSLLALSVPSLAAPPPAPTNVIYDAAPKQMIFDWDVVPGATRYEIWFQPQLDVANVKFAERAADNPHWTHNLSAHLIHWFDARWEIRACNADGCGTTGPINVGSTVVNMVGHVKPAQPQPFAAFGSAVDVSEDGSTMVVVARDEQRTTAYESATTTIYIFRNVNGGWRQEARFLPSAAQTGNGGGVSVSLAGNGNVLAVGIPDERYLGHAPTGGVENPYGGAAYVFRRNGTKWRQEQRLTNYQLFPGTAFGSYVALSEDARVLLVGDGDGKVAYPYRHYPTGWYGGATANFDYEEQADFALSGSGKYFYVRIRDSARSQIEIFDTETTTFRGQIDLVLPPTRYHYSAFAVDYTGDRVLSGLLPDDVTSTNYDASRWIPVVTIFRKSNGVYSVYSQLTPSSYQPTDYARRSFFGEYAAISHDGEFVAINDPHDAYAGRLVQMPPTGPFTGPPRGGIYLFEQKPGRYRLRRHIGDPANTSDTSMFGAMAFGRGGKTFIAAQPGEDSGVGGIHRAGDSPAYDQSMEGAGAVWLY